MIAEDLEHRLLTGLERVGSVLRILRRKSAKAAGLTATQARVLRILVRHGLAGLRGVELSRELGVSRASGGETVTALVNHGLLEQVADPTDGRARRVRLTRKGQRAHAKLAHWQKEALAVLADLGQKQRVEMLSTLIFAIQGLERAGMIPEARVCPSCEHFQENVAKDNEKPHRCALTGRAIGPGDLQVDCDAHEHATRARAS